MKFSNYFDLGFSVIPLRGKMPLVEWKKYQTTRATPEQIAQWDKTNHNVGIITGHISGVFVVDVDGEYPKDWPAMPDTWRVKTSKGYHYYFNMPTGVDLGNRARLAPNTDVRGEGGYVVAPPSRHPDTGHIYTWENPPSGHLADIPDWLMALLEKPKPEIVHYRPMEPNEPYIQAAIDGEASALQNAIEGTRNDQLNRSAFSLGQILPHDKVRDILKPIALSIGLNAIEIDKTLNSALRSALPRQVPERVIEEDCPLVKTIIKNHGKKQVVHSEVAPDLISNAPGMLGSLMDWMLETSLYPQPILALAAAIPCIGNVMAHRVRTETNLRTNFYTLGIAESGAGKEHARRCIARLYEHTNMTDTVLGDPASAVAVINAVKRGQGRGLMMIDEFGRFLDSLKGTATHTKMITTNMMYLYNAAGDLFTGQEYANNDLAGGRSDIDQPCLSIYATTVPSRFYSSLTSEETFDGFLSRWLVFETKRFDIEPRLERGKVLPPDSLTDELRWWQQQPTRSGNMAIAIEPRVVPLRDSAPYYAYIRDCRSKMATEKSAVAKAFWNRAAEHAAKLALVAHTGTDVDPETLDWAIKLTNSLTQAMIDNVGENMSDNRYEADLKRVLSILRSQDEDMNKSQLFRHTRWLDRRRRSDIIDSLIEAGHIEVVQVRQDEKQRPLTVYRVLD